MLGHIDSASKHVQKRKEKMTKCSLKATEFLLNADGHVLT